MCPAIAKAIVLLSYRPLRAAPNPRPAGTRSARLRCTRIANGEQPGQPPCPPAPAPAPELDGPVPANARDVLTAQIHALLKELRTYRAVHVAGTVRAATSAAPAALDRAQVEALLRAIGPLPSDRALPPDQHMLHAALFDLLRALRAEQMLHAQIERHTRKQQANALPGAQRGSASSGAVGAAIGLPFAAEAGATLGGQRENSTATFDDLAIAVVHTTTLNGTLSAGVGLQASPGAECSVGGAYTRGNAIIDISMRNHIHGLARASLARRLGGSAVLRGLKRLTGHRRDRYAERISRAQQWQPNVHRLLSPAVRDSRVQHSQPGALRPADAALLDAALPACGLTFAPRAPDVLLAELTTTVGTATARARYGVGSVSLSGQLSRTAFHTALPVRLTELDENGRPATADPSVRSAVKARVEALLDAAPPQRSTALGRLRDMGDDVRPSSLDARLAAVTQVAAEFHHLEALSRHALKAPAQARAPMASLARDWGCPSATCEAVMINMLDTLAWLQAVPEPPLGDEAALPTWTTLQKRAQAVATTIHGSQIPHNRSDVHHATHAFRDMTQRITTRRGTLDVTTELLAAGVSAQVSLAQHERDDPNPLRDGTYLEIAFTAQLSTNIAGVLAEVQKRLPAEWGGLSLDEPQRLLAPIAGSMTVSGSVNVLVRFFKPSFQTGPGFPEEARGAHLQAIRLGTGTAQALAVKVPVPLMAGVSSSIAMTHARTAQRTRHEQLCAGTLTGLLLRYQSLCADDQAPAETWAQLVASHGADLDRLADALATPASVPAQEGRYWLHRGASADDVSPASASGTPVPAWDARCPDHDVDARREQVHALFQRLLTAVRRVKAASPLVGDAQLTSPAPVARAKG